MLFFLTTSVPADRRAEAERLLVERLQRGEQAALRQLFDLCSGHALALATRVLRSASEAEEVVQESFVQLWRSAGTYDAARGGVSAWLMTIVRTRAIDRLRSRESSARAIQASSAGATPAAEPIPLELAEQRQSRERIQHALAALPAEQRQVVELAYYGGLSHSEIAEQTATPLGTVKTRMRLALEKLGEALGPEARP